MPERSRIDSLIDEVDGILVALQNVRRLATELRQAAEAAQRASGKGVDESTIALAPSLLFSGMTTAEAAARLGLGEEQVRRLLRRGLLAGISFGGHVGWRIPRAAVEAIAEDWDAQRLAHESAREAIRSNKSSQPKKPVRRNKPRT